MRIYLRPISLSDGHLIVKWRNTPSVASHCMNRTPITIESNERFFHENIEKGRYQQFIVERIEEQLGTASYPIATVYLKDIDKTNRRCELCIFTSDDQEWNTESQEMAVRLLLDKAFTELGMHKVYSYVFYRFLDEATLLKNAGFSIETVLRDEVVGADGSYSDVVRFSIFEQDWKQTDR